LVTLNGQTAHFHAGGQYPVPVINGVNQVGAVQGVNFIPYGVQLHFTPYINDRDRIRLVIDGEISTPSLNAGVLAVGNANVPAFSTRSVQTTVELREGQTLAVAGLIQQNISADARRIPGIGELPLVSRLLGFDRTSSGEQELVILITPELVHPLDCNERLPVPGADIYEPSDCEFYVHGRLESHVAADYRTAVRTDYTRLKMARQTESLYLAGPTGHDCEPRGGASTPVAPPTPGHATPVPAGPSPKQLPPADRR
jgi:pilus assembly protein CpaC